jgi:O-antigen/teichoic acid export membrane protein
MPPIPCLVSPRLGTSVVDPIEETKARRGATRRLPAGVVDAAFASLATFAAGLSAVTLFNDIDRGVYALFFTAFGLGVVIPWELILVPAEVDAVSYPVEDRMRRARDTLRLGVPMAMLGCLAIIIAAFLSRSLTDTQVVLGLTLTAAATTVLSPLQDHMRRLLHIAELNWQAATVSGVQLFGVVASLGVMRLLNTPVAVLPFGSLAIANAISLATALVLGDVRHQRPLEEPLVFRVLAKQGRWLVTQALIPSVAHFAVAAIVAGLAGAQVLGYAEAARVVAQPVLVLATGLTAVLAPRAMEAAMARDIVSARHTRRIYLSIMAGGGVLYLAAAATPWVGNPMKYLVPAAYIVSGLVAVTILANLIAAAMYLDINELVGARKARPMAIVAILTSPILVFAALTARTTEAFARPVGRLVRNAAQVVWYRAKLNQHYAERNTRVTP